MPFVLEYTFTRPNKEVEFPLGGPQEESLQQLREQYNISSEVLFSEDGLVRTLRHTAPSAQDYGDFYEKAQPIWEKAKIMQKCGDVNVDVSMSIVENT